MKNADLFRALLRAAALVLGVAATGGAGAAPQQQAGDIEQTDRLIIKYKDSSPGGKAGRTAVPVNAARQEAVQRAGRRHGISIRASHETGNGAQVHRLNRQVLLDEARAIAAQIMAQDPDVDYAEPDLLVQPQFIPNDPYFAEQWSYFETTGGIRLPEAWNKATGNGITVAVIDTGYRPHADMSGKFIGGYDFISEATKMSNDGNGRDSDASDPGNAVAANECGSGKPKSDQASSWHGTHVAGTVAANTNNSTGVAGVAFNARILPVRVLGKCGGYMSDVADGIIWASGGAVAGVPANPNPARVLNLSLGVASSTCSATLQQAIDSARSRGSVVVVSAGNDHRDAAAVSPANCAGVITVAATNAAGMLTRYSNYGAPVDIAAPGGETMYGTDRGIMSTMNAGATGPAADSYGYKEGTSMAAPHVAGTVALMLSKNAALTPDEVESKLKGSARAFAADCTACGAGFVDAYAAVAAATPKTVIFETESNNDALANANYIGDRDTLVNANIGSAADTDYYRVNLPAGSRMSATLAPRAASADYNLYAYSSNGAQLARVAFSENGAGAIDSVSVVNGGTGTATFYIRVTYYSGGAGLANGGYLLKLGW